MKQNAFRRILSGALVLMMLLALLPAGASAPKASAAEDGTYVLDTTTDLAAFAQGEKADGDYLVVNDYFTIHFSAKNKVDGSKKTFDDGYTATQRLNFGGKTTAEMNNTVEFTTDGPATIKLWWVSGGDGREMALYNAAGEIIASTDASVSVKNALYIDTLSVEEAGTYFIGVPTGSNYLFKAEVKVAAAEPVITVNTLDTTNDLAAFAQGEKADGDYELVNGYFTIHYSAKNKVDGSNKLFDDGYTATQRLNFGGKTTAEMNNTVEFTTTGAAVVKIWWVSGGDGREMAIYNASGEIVTATDASISVKNALYIDTLNLEEAGTYFLGVPTGSNYLFKLEVTESSGGAVEVTRKPWAEVAAPVIDGAEDDGNGNIIVNVTATVGKDGADELIVCMYDAQGNELASRRSIAEKDVHALSFAPSASGEYTFKAFAFRAEEQPKESATAIGIFKLVLQSPIITSATSKGAGSVEVVWVGVPEAESYALYAGETLMGTTEALTLIATSLQVGQEYAFTVVAIRGEDRATSAPVNAVATEEMQQTWGFTYYGPSTNSANNGYNGSLNEDGKVTVYSTGGKGKIQPKAGDGVAFYYTAVPTTHNFTLKAKVTVDSWTYSNGQEGFGLMAADKLGISGDSTDFFNNAYLVGCTKIEYRYDNEKIYDAAKYANGSKYSMKLGLGVIEKVGVNAETMDKFLAGDSNTVNNYSTTLSLESAAAYWEMPAGTYNVVGNETSGNIVNTNIENNMLTTFILEIQKNNTGYFVTYYAENGTVLAQQKFYGADELNQLDSEFVYVGFFASRNATATFSDVQFSTVLCSEDAPAEEIPVTKIDPTVTLSGGAITTKQNYELLVDTNVSGTINVQVAYETVAENVAITGGQRLSLEIPMKAYGNNNIKVIFTPDGEQYLGENTVLSSTSAITQSTDVVWNKGNYHSKVIYVGPNGLPTGDGSKAYPYDLHTAVNNVVPGQVLVLMEGVYKLPAALKIERGMDGTAESMIYMIADPEVATRPVLDFQGLYSGFVTGGDYWYFQGFDVANSLAGQKGFQISGNYNVVDSVNAYNNGNTGIQLSRLMGSDLYDAWPAYNTILNCTSYGNCDPGYEDADGFAVKLTVGPGNVLDGCVAYLNADDGYDLYAKSDTGPIGTVTIKNSLAYANGYIYRDGEYINAGNGNGFKMGGSSISGYHVLENCIAFYNKSKGIDSNSCPDIQVFNSISYNNGSYNVAFYTNIVTKPTDFYATGIISFRNPADPYFGSVNSGEQLKYQGTQDLTKIYGTTNYYWTDGASVNSEGAAFTADMFVSMTFAGVERNADGTINMGDFLKLNASAPADAGVDTTKYTVSGGLETLPQDLEHTFSETYSYLNTVTNNVLHWRECECGAKTDLANHTMTTIIDAEATPEANGKKHDECTVCGYKAQTITIYYQAPVEPTEPTEPATQPTEPGSQPQPSQSATQPGGEPAPEKDNTMVIVAVAVVIVLGIGGFSVGKFVVKKKEN